MAPSGPSKLILYLRLRVYIKTGGSDGHACYLGAVVAGREPGYLLPRRVESPLVGEAPVTFPLDPLQFIPNLDAGELGESLIEDVPFFPLEISIKKSSQLLEYYLWLPADLSQQDGEHGDQTEQLTENHF